MLTLHSYFRSSASYRVRIALNLKGLEFRTIPVHLVKHGAEQHAADFATLNPAELVPVLTDGDLVLTQSLPIIEYVDELHPQPPLLPSHVGDRAKVRALAQAIACEIHPLCNLRVLQRLQSNFSADSESQRAWYAHWVNMGLTVIEAMLTNSEQNGRYCHGDTPSLADCCLVPQVFNAERFGISLDPFPAVRRINETCLLLSEFQRAAPAAQPDATSPSSYPAFIESNLP